MASSDCNLPKESLMHEINSLFAPPTAESYGKKGLAGIPSARRAKKTNEGSASNAEACAASVEHISNAIPSFRSQSTCRDDPFWRKPRANCHEYCDSCGCTEGDRLVCDRCPASFHLECLDPPLESDEAPIGVWFCHRCSMLLKDEEDQASSSSSQSTAVTETSSARSGRAGRLTGRRPDCTQSLNMLAGAALSQAAQHPLQSQSQPHVPSKRSVLLSRAVMNERALTGRSSRSAAWGESAYVADTEESELRSLWNVIKYAQYQNPKEFDLPKDLMPGVKLPGSYKTLAERKGKSIIELENGFIPHPIRRCFVCSRTCMFAPLLPCDYCSSCFHLDCLDPPLPHFPSRSDRWMCPNHIEHTVERNLVQSIRLTERMRIWSELTKVFSHDGLPTDESAHGYQKPLVMKVKPENTDDPVQPMAIQKSSDESVTQTSRPDTPPIEPPVAPYELTYGPDEEATILADLMRKVQRGRAEKADLLSSILGTMETLIGESNEDRFVNFDSVGRHLWRLNRTESMKLRLIGPDANRTRIVVPAAVKSMYIRRIQRVPRPLEANMNRKRLSTRAEDDENAFVRGLLAFYIQSSTKSLELEPSTENPDSSVNLSATVEHGGDKDSVLDYPKSVQKTERYPKQLGIAKNLIDQLNDLSSCLEYIPQEKRSKFDLPLIISLAKQQAKQLSGRTLEDQDSHYPTPALIPISEPVSSKLRARAVFTPCGGTCGPVVKMRYRQLTVGTSPDCHLCLTNYRLADVDVECHFGSPHHATIFYDEWTHHFELINYSEFGSRVDGITYSNDISPKPVYRSKTSGTVDRLRHLIQDESLTNKKPSEFTERSQRLRMVGRRHEASFNFGTLCDCIVSELDPNIESNLQDSLKNTASPESDDPSMLAGWEGPALLRHGSLVQFGCYKFVMGLVDFAPTKPSSFPMEFPVSKAMLLT
ncbi:PHD-finger [Paragonimus heterotremus]|uniref:PHD-finger n=1 Tax=Paragonimus heterotremus TaxID=100268 RepID=A0A8J4TLC2_9TREM|nr:PHD-finger [Paragonimus heterotremus]